MKVAISSENNYVSAHFGRAPEFTFVTIEDNEIINTEVHGNPGHSIGSIPRFIKENGAECLIVGGIGHRAIQFFRQYGIEIIMGVQGPINDIINALINGTLLGGESFCDPRSGKGYGVEKVHTDADDHFLPHF